MSARRRRPFCPALIALAVSLGTTSAAAQPSALPADRARSGSLRSRLGVEAAEPLLRAEASELRLRAIEKLGRAGTAAALELLSDALEPGGAARTANERLTAVRALALHARDQRARGALVRAMGGALTRDEPADLLVRQTAALALARAGDQGALSALAQALRQPGRVSETARLALRAHPPKTLDPILGARGVPTPALAGLLGDLKALRGRELLVTLAQSGSPALRSEALLALAKVDPSSGSALARGSVGAEQHRAVRIAAARVLASTKDAEAARALEQLFADPSLVGDALTIALEAPSAALAPVLSRVVPTDPGDAERLLSALGRAGGKLALDRLERTLGHAELGWAAAYALALSPDSDAEDRIERALERPETRRDAARAAVLRQRALRSRASGLDDALEALERSRAAADRGTAAFCRALLDGARGAELVASRDPVIVRAVARAALDEEVALASARRLANEQSPELRAVLALSLARPAAADEVPNAVLTALVESRGAASHLAALALAARDGDELRPRLRELLASGDSVLRAHVALGLVRSKEPGAVGILEDAYRFESDPEVRRAIVRTLAERSESGRERTLRLAADLDPDDLARETARRALRRGEKSPKAPERGTLWLRVSPPPSGEASTLAVVLTERGVALPAAPDSDGSVLLAGLPGGPVGVTLALAAPGGDSSKPRAK